MTLAIDRYEVKRLLGQGAMGKVYLASDPKLGRDVAIKVLNTNTDDAAARHRFRLEARAIATLKHPNIVELYDYSGEEAPDLFLVMEFVPGRTLHELIGERGPMSEATALCVAHEIALALSHAHERQVIHSDLKPENVILHNGRIVLMDFGVAKAIASTSALGDLAAPARAQSFGTPGFMAPEQLDGRPLDAGTDIFALGALLYYLVTGQSPFEAPSFDEVAKRTKKGRFEDPRFRNQLISPGFSEILRATLQADPAQRLSSATDLKDRVIEVLHAHGVTEVRAELVSYDENPAAHALAQKERSLDVLLRDLKLAIKDRDEPRVQAIVARMQAIAPLADRMRSVTGIRWDPKKGPRLAPERRGPRLGWFAGGLVLGVLVGALAAGALLSADLVPKGWVNAMHRVVQHVSGTLPQLDSKDAPRH